MINLTIDISKIKQVARILNNIKVDDKGCWLWTGDQTTNGYGRVEFKEHVTEGQHVRAKRRRTRAHRFSYQTFKGEIKDDLLVCHSCDVKLCVNPEHLWLGTHQDNMEDAYKKGIIKRNT